MSDYLNLIQLISGILAATLVAVGLFITVKSLNPEKYETIPVKKTVISTLVILAGLLFYAVTKTCTNLTAATEEHYELWTVYLVSAGEVFKMFGFILLIPVVFRLFKPRNRKPQESEDGIPEGPEES